MALSLALAAGVAAVHERGAVGQAARVHAAAWLGVELDQDANRKNGPRISTASSRTTAWVIPTNEELMIARQTQDLLSKVSVSDNYR